MNAQRFDAAEIKSRYRLADVVGLKTALRRRGRDHVGLCPFHKETTPSFTVNEAKGFYHCFGCGAHGDVVDFVKESEGIGFAEAIKRLTENGTGFSTPAPVRPRSESIDLEHRRRLARTVWRNAQHDIAGTSAELYLRSRRLGPLAYAGTHERAWPRSLRFISHHRYRAPGHSGNGTFWPTMVAAMQRYDVGNGESPVVAVHRTYLARDGSGKAPVAQPKKMLGPKTGAAIRFGPPASRLGLAEGIETGLSVVAAVPDLTVWAAGDLGNMGVVVMPPQVREIILCMDNDTKDRAGVERALQRARETYVANGIRVEVRWPPKGSDFNDVLRSEE
jgi:DNA primase